MARIDEIRAGLSALSGWPLALGAGVVGFLIWSLQTATGAASNQLATPGSSESLGAALVFWVHSGWYALPIVFAVLFASLVTGAALSGLVVFGPSPFGTLLARLNELGGAVPAVLVLMLWRVGGDTATRVGFVVLLSGLFAIEIAQLLSETGRRIERTTLAPDSTVAPRWRDLLQHSVHELRAQLATQAALVSSAVFGLDAALSFVGLGLDGMPTWGVVIGEAARSEDVATSVVALSLVGSLATVIGAHQLLSRSPMREPILELRKPAKPEPELPEDADGDAVSDD
jgi:ABC-type dipeptide/oligopeptide/nickel transport system permease subunit